MDCEIAFAPKSGLMRTRQDPESVDAIASRLIALRGALGYAENQIGFATLVGISPQAWNNYERSRNRINLEQAMKVWRATGATLEWIYAGVASGLPVSLAEALRTKPSTIKSA